MGELIRIQVGDETLELDLDLENITLREAMTLESSLGEAFDALMSGKAAFRPSTIEALIWAKLHKLRPELEREAFDFDLGEMAALLESPPAVDVPRPKAVGTG